MNSLFRILRRALCTGAYRIAIAVGIAAAIASSAHAATPFEVRVTGNGPDVLLIPGLASSGDVWDDTVKALAPHHRCHVFTLAGFAGVPAQPGHLHSVVGLVWRSVVLWMLLVALLTLANVLG